MKKKKKKIRLKKPISNRKGFSLIELMAVLIIVGALSAIAIAAATSAIGKSRAEKTEQNKKNVVMAAKMYVQNNRDLLPRNIGETVLVKFDVLKKSNYLKETVTNDKGESCMENSVIRIYKLSNSEYTYTPYLYCGSEKVPGDLPTPTPDVRGFKFNYNADTDKDKDGNPIVDENGNPVISSVSKASFSFKIFGKRETDTIGSGEIYGYSYSILVKQNNTEFTEAFSSGTLSGNNKTEIEFTSKPIVEYIDITGSTTVKIVVNVTNVEGGTFTYDSGSSGEVSRFDDRIPPICGEVLGAAANDNDWISKSNMDTVNYPRVISVKCSDGDGSGCKRDLFSDSWPDQKDYLYGTKFANVKLEDNAVMSEGGTVENANSTLCRVKVNADIQSPSLSLKVVNPSGKTTETATISVADQKDPNKNYPSTTLKSDVYVGQKGKNGGTQWLNKANYDKGISYNVTITDNIYLYRWEWLTNPGYIKGESSDNEIRNNVSISNPDGASGVFVTDINDYEDKDFGPVTENITVSFYTEGMRYGVLRVYDKSGNYTDINIYANLDRTAPPVPTTHYEKIDGSAYSSVTLPTLGNLERNHWSTKHIFAYIENQKDDYLTENAAFKVELSGWKEFRHVFSKQTGITRDGIVASNYTFADQNEEVTSEKKDNNRKYGYTIKDEGTHTIKFRSCDNAENCSEYNFNREVNDYTYNAAPYVKIDTIAPSCSLEIAHPRGEPLCVNSPTSSYSKCSGNTPKARSVGWLGWNDNVNDMNYTASGDNKKIALVYGLCFDIDSSSKQDTTFASLCAGINGSVVNELGIVPADAEMSKVISETKVVFPKVLQPWHRYDYDIDTTTAGAGGNNVPGKVVDIAGNSADCSKEQLHTVKADYTRPVCTATTTVGGGAYNGEWLGKGKSVVYETNGVDNGVAKSGIWDYYSVFKTTYSSEMNSTNATTNRSRQNMFDNGTVAYDRNGNHQSSRLYIYDKAGNRSNDPCPAKTIKIDKTGPMCIVDAKANGSSTKKSFAQFTNDFGDYHGDWVNGDYTISVRRICSTDFIGDNLDPYGDNIGSGCPDDLDAKTRTYSKNPGGILQGRRGAISDSSSGQVQDYVGNTTPCGLFDSVRIDDELPVCSASRSAYHSGAGYWNNAAEGVTVTSTCSDHNRGSGCDENPEKGSLYKATKTRKYEAVPDQAFKKENGGSVDYGESGWVIDKVGNVSAQKCPSNFKVYIDDQDPVCTEQMNTPSGWVRNTGNNQNSYPYFKASCNDGSGSGCVKTCFGRVFMNDYNGSYQDENVAEDKVGNKKDCPNKGNWYTVKVQYTKPTCGAWTSPNPTEEGFTGSSSGVTVNWQCGTASNNSNGNSPASINNCGGRSTSSTSTTSVYSENYVKNGRSYTVTDVAGNSTTCSQGISSQTIYRFSETTNCKVCCTGDCYDRYSGSCSGSSCDCDGGSTTSKSCKTVEGVQYGSCYCKKYNSYYEQSHCSKCGNNGGWYDIGWTTSSSRSDNSSSAYKRTGSKVLYRGNNTSSYSGARASSKNNENPTSCAAGSGPGGLTTPTPTTTPSTSPSPVISSSPSPVISPSPSPSTGGGLYEPCRDEWSNRSQTAIFWKPIYNAHDYNNGVIYNDLTNGTSHVEIVGTEGMFLKIRIVNGISKMWSHKGQEYYYIYNKCLREVGSTESCLNLCKG